MIRLRLYTREKSKALKRALATSTEPAALAPDLPPAPRTRGSSPGVSLGCVSCRMFLLQGAQMLQMLEKSLRKSLPTSLKVRMANSWGAFLLGSED